MRRSLTSWGLVLVTVGGLSLLVSPERITMAADVLAACWPYLLVALGVVNFGRAVLPDGAWIAPVVLIGVGVVGLAFRSESVVRALPDVWPATVATAMLAAGSVMAASGATRPGLAIAPLLSRSLRVSGRPGEALVAVTVLAELRIDMTDANWEGASAVRAIAVLGRVHLCLPHELEVIVEDGGFLVPIYETGTRRRVPGRVLVVQCRGFAGWVQVVRA